MGILSNSSKVVIMEISPQHLLYTIAPEYSRYADLKSNINSLKDFATQTKTVPQIYDVQVSSPTEDQNEYISLLVENPKLNSLNKQNITKLNRSDIKNIGYNLIDTIQKAREHNIYHLDIGFHSVYYDPNLENFKLIDWYDSVLSLPADPPIFISSTIPPELNMAQTPLKETQLKRAENFQISCLIIQLIDASGYRMETSQTILNGCINEPDVRPTLRVLQNALEQF